MLIFNYHIWRFFTKKMHKAGPSCIIRQELTYSYVKKLKMLGGNYVAVILL